MTDQTKNLQIDQPEIQQKFPTSINSPNKSFQEQAISSAEKSITHDENNTGHAKVEQPLVSEDNEATTIIK